MQRDYVALIRACVGLLATNGALYFSTNLRGFKFDEAALPDVVCVNITADTIDEDFRRSLRIHHCWKIQSLLEERS